MPLPDDPSCSKAPPVGRLSDIQEVGSMRKDYVCVWLMLAMLLTPGALFAGGSQEAAAETDEVVELTMWFGREQFMPADNFETFHAENPNIRVNTDVIPLEEANSSYVRAYRAGNAPDIIQANLRDVPGLAEQGMLMDVTPVLDAWRNEDADDFAGMSQGAWEMPSHDGVPYGMTLHGAPYYFIYRLDLFEAAGIPEPRTYEDAIEAARQLHDDNLIGFAIPGHGRHSAWFHQHIVAMGAPIVDNNVRIDSEGGIAAIEFYQTIAREGLIHPETLSWDSGEMRAAFIGGNAAMIFEGVNVFPAFEEGLVYNESFKATPPLSRAGEDPAQVRMWHWPYLVSSEASDKADAIKEVFKYLSRTEIVSEVAKRYQPTTRMAVFDDPEYQAVQPWWEDLADSYFSAVGMPSHVRQVEIGEVLVDLKQEALTNYDADPVEMAQRYQTRMDDLMER